LLPVFTLLGIPATLDLLQTSGVAFIFAVIVFIVFLLNIMIPILRASGKLSHPLVNDWYKWVILVSVIGGLAVTVYTTFIEATDGPIMCGQDSSKCITVMNSPYATLFGVLPVGVLGLFGYVGILISWLGWQFGPQSIQKFMVLSLWGMCIFGVLFSTYLTFLEPFVIGATCMWCISSAVLMIGLLLTSNPAAYLAFTPPLKEEFSTE
jgi:uncharacterized membrane protein